jgi:hypothetical protein
MTATILYAEVHPRLKLCCRLRSHRSGTLPAQHQPGGNSITYGHRLRTWSPREVTWPTRKYSRSRKLRNEGEFAGHILLFLVAAQHRPPTKQHEAYSLLPTHASSIEDRQETPWSSRVPRFVRHVLRYSSGASNTLTFSRQKPGSFKADTRNQRELLNSSGSAKAGLPSLGISLPWCLR